MPAMKTKSSLIIMTFCALASSALAAVKPNALFSDNAVLQQNANIPVWGTARDGEKVTVTFDGETGTAIAKDGKWMVRLKPHKAGGPFTLTIAGENTVKVNNVLVGEVWICSGQSNMVFPLSKTANAAAECPLANYPRLRMIGSSGAGALQPQAEMRGKWTECSPTTAGNFSAVGYYFGRDIFKATGAPVGMINASVNGTPAQQWTSLSGLEKEPALQGYVEAVKSLIANSAQNGPVTGIPACGFFNGKIAPLIPYAIKGVIWYQGEANMRKPFEYRTLFPRLIADWREKWGQGDFPFLFVQIAPFKGCNPEIREAQLLTLKKTPNTAMTVVTDFGGVLHPPQKEPVGARLALAARALAYGEKIEYSGPEYDSMQINQNKAVLSFKHIGSGLVAKDGPLKGFMVAGSDKKFVDATAEIQGDTVVVSSGQAPSPAAVRFGFASLPDVNLYNKEGLPASPFCTNPESLTQDPPEVKKPAPVASNPNPSNVAPAFGNQ
jgi:sialate O-acetylesterase